MTASRFVEDRQGADVIRCVRRFAQAADVRTRNPHRLRRRRRGAELGGPFWLDYRRSVRIPDQWEDTDSWPVNYIGHPIHGACGRIHLARPRPKRAARVQPELGGTGRRAGRRLPGPPPTACNSSIGPLSEASIGNVGLNPATNGWVDHVVTPIGAFGLIVAEDALDKFFVKWVGVAHDAIPCIASRSASSSILRARSPTRLRAAGRGTGRPTIGWSRRKQRSRSWSWFKFRTRTQHTNPELGLDTRNCHTRSMPLVAVTASRSGPSGADA